MFGNKSKRGDSDRKPASEEKQYEVAYFAGRHSISMAEARRIIHEAGSSRSKADAAVVLFKTRQ